MRVLIVEDERAIADFVRQGLNEAGYAVDVAEDGRSGLDYALAANYDAYILDILLPGLNGLKLLRDLRRRGDKTPTLMLTARDTIDDRVEGLDAGADDYLVKPFAFPELLVRVRALLRRPPLQTGTILQVGDLALDTACREVKRGNRSIDLSPREFAVLEYLMRHPNQVLTRTQIGEHVWNFDFYNESNVIDVYIGYLRRKIEHGYDVPLIHTIRGVGCRIFSSASIAWNTLVLVTQLTAVAPDWAWPLPRRSRERMAARFMWTANPDREPGLPLFSPQVTFPPVTKHHRGNHSLFALLLWQHRRYGWGLLAGLWVPLVALREAAPICTDLNY